MHPKRLGADRRPLSASETELECELGWSSDTYAHSSLCHERVHRCCNACDTSGDDDFDLRVIDAQLRQRSCAADHESCLAECDQSELDERHALTSTLSAR